LLFPGWVWNHDLLPPPLCISDSQACITMPDLFFWDRVSLIFSGVGLELQFCYVWLLHSCTGRATRPGPYHLFFLSVTWVLAKWLLPSPSCEPPAPSHEQLRVIFFLGFLVF
jgi:hypothetical protein